MLLLLLLTVACRRRARRRRAVLVLEERTRGALGDLRLERRAQRLRAVGQAAERREDEARGARALAVVPSALQQRPPLGRRQRLERALQPRRVLLLPIRHRRRREAAAVAESQRRLERSGEESAGVNGAQLGEPPRPARAEPRRGGAAGGRLGEEAATGDELQPLAEERRLLEQARAESESGVAAVGDGKRAAREESRGRAKIRRRAVVVVVVAVVVARRRRRRGQGQPLFAPAQRLVPRFDPLPFEERDLADRSGSSLGAQIEDESDQRRLLDGESSLPLRRREVAKPAPRRVPRQATLRDFRDGRTVRTVGGRLDLGARERRRRARRLALHEALTLASRASDAARRVHASHFTARLLHAKPCVPPRGAPPCRPHPCSAVSAPRRVPYHQPTGCRSRAST